MGLFDKLFGKKKQKKRVRTATKTVQRKKRKKKTKEQALQEHITLKEWREELQRLQQHPLTQAKIINQNLLNSIMELLEQINQKLDMLNTRIDRLEAKRTKVKVKVEKPQVKLSKQEQKILAYIKAKKTVQANFIANKLNISRSNASLKLNKLYQIGYLDKQQDGKDVYYSFKNN